MGDIDMMTRPIGELSAGIIKNPAPIPMAAVTPEIAVRPPGRRA